MPHLLECTFCGFDNLPVVSNVIFRHNRLKISTLTICSKTEHLGIGRAYSGVEVSYSWKQSGGEGYC
jgi:hypothetical protein